MPELTWLAPLTIVVGSGGVGKTTLAAAMGLISAEAATDTLVMTFDPSLRLKDTLGVGEEEAREAEVRVPVEAPGSLSASLLDARRTFDRLVERYSEDDRDRDRILHNRFYNHLAGGLAGILEYMAVERLFEVADEGRYGRIILDTPPTRQALDFLEAPARIIEFLDSGALRIALKPWFDNRGRLRPVSLLGGLGRRFESFLDHVVGLDLLRDMAEFFQAFAPLFDGFRERAARVQELLRSTDTRFILVSGPGEESIPDTLFFARHLQEAGYRLGPVLVNRVHPRLIRGDDGAIDPDPADGRQLLAWLGERDHRGLEALTSLVSADRPPVAVPLVARPPSDLAGLGDLAEILRRALS